MLKIKGKRRALREVVPPVPSTAASIFSSLTRSGPNHQRNSTVFCEKPMLPTLRWDASLKFSFNIDLCRNLSLGNHKQSLGTK